MLQVTKIFRFEMAHALQGHAGACRHVHGHSYQLHVTVRQEREQEGYLPGAGMLIDFKELKKLVKEAVIRRLDHQLLLSGDYLAANPGILRQENLLVLEAEPSAENLLLFVRNAIREKLPAGIALAKLKLYETADSYAEWVL
ncbi:6-pyruvoyl trahydropterin synthase family protein [Chitinophaga cymbidii]|uniref:6-carboxy-5,6,7,8-tetrahydropterin synthase n=1 Tax=Chitinophaga cymbidii TaxID=1096750 RepID=A0A512RSR5_9BACT|nr:6-carboxytetrahydropterin synthase [Chitinophaga cymbidii]GEP98740.1 6-carboxytetrahydropterin synthase QueD [Chitinophaga cymbidii]